MIGVGHLLGADVTRSEGFHRALLGIAISFALSAALAGCSSGGVVVWRKGIVSPNRSWKAIATTTQFGGFGSAMIENSVALQKRGLFERSHTILLLAGGKAVKRPYKFDSQANDGGGVDLSFEWLDNSHLLVRYMPGVSVYKKVKNYSGINILYQYD